MPKVYVLVGPPLSGKSTYRRKLYNELISQGKVPGYINRDEIRWHFYGKMYKATTERENKVTQEFKRILSLLYSQERDIILDNTNIKQKYVNQIINKLIGYEVEYIYFDVPLWKLHLRNIKRLITDFRWIPIKVINKFYKDFQHARIRQTTI